MKKKYHLLAAVMIALCMTILLSFAASASGNMTYDTIKAGDTLVVVTNHGVNMRKTPSLSGARITTLPTNATVVVVRKVVRFSGWLYVTYGDQNGYVYTSDTDCGNFFSKVTPGSIKYYTMSGYQATVKASRLNVRKTPYITGTVIGTLTNGQVVDAIGNTSNGWVKVSYLSGKTTITGYVSGNYVTVAKKAKKKVNVNAKTSFANVYGYAAKAKSSKKIKVYSSANTHSAVVGKVNKKDILYVLKKSKNKVWYNVIYYAHPEEDLKGTVTQTDSEYMCTGYVLASDVKALDVFKKLTLSNKKMTLKVGTKKTLSVKDSKYKIYSNIADMGATVKFKSSKKSVATVDAATGEITAVKKGKAKITATITAGKGKNKRTRKLTCTVIVKK